MPLYNFEFRKKVRFFNLKYSYLSSESIVLDVQYSNDFIVADRDWIGILPAGFFNVAHFAAFKMAPAKRKSKYCQSYGSFDDNFTGYDSFDSTVDTTVSDGIKKRRSFGDFYNNKILQYDQNVGVAPSKNNFFQRLAGEHCGELHKIVFKANESKLPPRNFYQLAYIRQSPGLGCQILATSCVFYVETLCASSPQHEGASLLAGSLSLNSFMTPSFKLQILENEKKKQMRHYQKQFSRRTISVQQNSANTCTIFKNLFCGISTSNSFPQWSSTCAEEEETNFSHRTYVFPESDTSLIPSDGHINIRSPTITEHSDSGVDESEDSVSANRGEPHTEWPKLLNKSPFLPESISVDSKDSSQSQPSCHNSHDNKFQRSQQQQNTLKSSIAHFFSEFFHGSESQEAESKTEFRNCKSMYEIGANTMPNTPSSYFAGSLSSMEMSNQHEYYQKIICQLTISNSNMARENELLTRRMQELESLLKDHVQHLNSVYYTLFRNGYSALQFPDGEKVHLSQFRGALLNFLPNAEVNYGVRSASKKQSNSANEHNLTDIACVIKEHQVEQRNSDQSSDSSVSSVSLAESDELKTAMLRCITRPKYDDMDEFVSWLNQDTPGTSQSYRDIPAGSDAETSQNSQQQFKSKSLEEQVEARLRLSNRQPPLQRVSRVDSSQHDNHSNSVGYVSPRQTVRTMSESELRTRRSFQDTVQSCQFSPTNNKQQQFQQQLSAREQSMTTPMATVTNSNTVSARNVKSKAARLRAQSVNGTKIGGFLSGSSLGARRSNGMNKSAESPRKSLSSMRSPILTLGRVAPPKVGRNLI